MELNLLIENQCSSEKIADTFLPVVEDAIVVYQTVFDDAVLNIRLMGSVARGEAGRYSDVDFIAVLSVSPTTTQMRRVEEQERKFRQKYPLISKVDLEAVAEQELGEFRRFVFATDSVSLFGLDKYSSRYQAVDRQKLVEMITPDLPYIVEEYSLAVENTDKGNEQQLSFYSRLIGKDILKCLRRISLINGGSYERNIGKIYHQLLQYAPKRKKMLHELFELYANPSSNRERLLAALGDVKAKFL